MSYKNLISYGETLLNALKSIDYEKILLLIQEIVKKIDGNGEIFLVGNGGSAANAHHIAGDYSKTFSILGKCLKISCISDNDCYLTAAANDIDFSEVYEILIGSRIMKNDLLILFSGSGNSMNLIKAARKAKKAGIKTSALVGYNGGALKNIVDIPIHFTIEDMEIAEDCQITTFHYIKQKIVNELCDVSKKSSSKYDKRTKEDLIA